MKLIRAIGFFLAAVMFCGFAIAAATPQKSTATFTQVVSGNPVAYPTTPAKAKILVSSVQNPAPANGGVNLYIMVQGVAGGPIPTGSITISGNGQSETVPLGLDGVVECTEYGVEQGSYSLLFTFNSADNNYR